MIQGEHYTGPGQVFCSGCGRSIPQNADFCPHCGVQTESNPRFCGNCGASLRPGTRLCASCGEATEATTVPPTERGGIGGAQVEYAGFWVRSGAFVIDAILTGVVSAVIDAVIGFPGVGSILTILYYVLFTGLKGQTPGKIALHISVIDARGNPPGIGRALLREVFGKLVSTLGLLVGFFWIILDPEKRGWHDHIAGTFVVRTQPSRT